MPVTLYLLCGKSFSGKSTLAEAIAQQTGAIVVGLDSINAERGLLGGLGIPDQEWAASHDVALQRVEDALDSGRSVVVDDTNCFRFLRDGYRSVAQRFGIPSVLLYLDVPVQTLRQRMAANASSPGRSSVTEEVLTDLLSKFEAPAPDEQAVLVPPGSPAAAWVAHNIAPHHPRRVDYTLVATGAHRRASEVHMKRVTGIGGIFFKARDPVALGAWYEKHLGIDVQDWGGAVFRWTDEEGIPSAGTTIWSVSTAESDQFAPGKASFMVNYRVADLHGLLAALRSEGCDVLEKTEESEYGKFGWVIDPEGNKVELWQPPEGQ